MKSKKIKNCNLVVVKIKDSKVFKKYIIKYCKHKKFFIEIYKYNSKH